MTQSEETLEKARKILNTNWKPFGEDRVSLLMLKRKVSMRF